MTGIRPVRAVVLLSGSGTTLQNFLDRAAAGTCPIAVAGVIGSRTDAFGLERARRAGIPTEVVPMDRRDPSASSGALTAAVDQFAPALVCLAGFNFLWVFSDRYVHRVMNVHPALLPRHGGRGFYGHHVHEAVLRAGERETGCTVHFADREYDRGPVILQRRVRVEPGDTPETLAARVQAAEREAYPEAVTLFAAGRLRVEAGKVLISPGKTY